MAGTLGEFRGRAAPHSWHLQSTAGDRHSSQTMGLVHNTCSGCCLCCPKFVVSPLMKVTATSPAGCHHASVTSMQRQSSNTTHTNITPNMLCCILLTHCMPCGACVQIPV
jgi:hypothetical protein